MIPYNTLIDTEIIMKLTPHFQGKFEVFRDEEGNQYARMEMIDKSPGSYEWFKYDFWKEAYEMKTFLSKELEETYKIEET